MANSDGEPGTPELDKVVPVTAALFEDDEGEDLRAYLKEARDFLQFYNWCGRILDEYAGVFVPGVIGQFLFRIEPTRPDVDSWIWVIVGDLPPTYLTCDQCPNPAAALDGYIGAMSDWVDAAAAGKSVADLIPVNVPATPKNAEMLRKRLAMLKAEVLSPYVRALSENGGGRPPTK